MQLALPFQNRLSRPDRYFFALMPDGATARRIDRLARDLQGRLGLRERLRGTAKYHLTLWGVEDDLGPESQMVARMREVGNAIDAPSFRVAFDHAADFGDRLRNPAFALAMSEALPAAEALQSTLADGMRRIGCRDRRSFKPHLTLFYHRHSTAPVDIDQIGWTAQELLLVRSIDQQPYVYLHRWAFRTN